MSDRFELFGEIQYGHELSFEQVGELENLLCEQLETALEAFGPAHLDLRPTGDELCFTSSVGPCLAEDLRQALRELSAILPPGSRGRLAAVAHGLGPVHVWVFSSRGVEDAGFIG